MCCRRCCSLQTFDLAQRSSRRLAVCRRRCSVFRRRRRRRRRDLSLSRMVHYIQSTGSIYRRFAHTRDSHTHVHSDVPVSQSSFPTSFTVNNNVIPLLVEEGDLEAKRKEGIQPDAVVSCQQASVCVGRSKTPPSDGCLVQNDYSPIPKDTIDDDDDAMYNDDYSADPSTPRPRGRSTRGDLWCETRHNTSSLAVVIRLGRGPPTGSPGGHRDDDPLLFLTTAVQRRRRASNAALDDGGSQTG